MRSLSPLTTLACGSLRGALPLAALLRAAFARPPSIDLRFGFLAERFDGGLAVSGAAGYVRETKEDSSTVSRILLGVSGGIAAYKACELVRQFVQRGHEVRVVATPHALEFVSPLTLQTLSGAPV